MAVNIRDIEYVAGLAKLYLSEEQKQKFTQKLDSILTYVQQLNPVKTTEAQAN
jgi:aspartyl-tRNA(Asn)/glutamyl-tRNA(Gln) amidotransferase subunit C